jgi:hypothetical protein
MPLNCSVSFLYCLLNLCISLMLHNDSFEFFLRYVFSKHSRQVRLYNRQWNKNDITLVDPQQRENFNSKVE